MLERRKLKDVLSELELAELGIVRKGPDAASRAQLRGTRSIELGPVTSYDPNREQKQSGSSFGLLGFGTRNRQLETKDYVAIDIRLVDNSTCEVVGSRTVEERGRPPPAPRGPSISVTKAPRPSGRRCPRRSGRR